MHTTPQGGIVLERLAYDPVAWEEILAHYPEAEVFHSAGWLAFLAASQHAEPVVAIVRADGRPVGHFVGGIVRRFGVRILGSPMRGWGTESMGFLLDDESVRRGAADALVPFAFDVLGCLHIELSDRWLTTEQMEGSGYAVEEGSTYVIDLSQSEDDIFAQIRSNTRQYIRRAAKRGLTAEVASGPEFADEFHEQLRDVFASQGLVPTYDVERVRQLIVALEPTGQLLLLRIRAPDGACLSTSIFVGRNRTATAWGAAFFRKDAAAHPNEPLWWEAIRTWHERGAIRLDMGGRGGYKEKFGGVAQPTPLFLRSRYGGLRYGRAAARRFAKARQNIVGAMRRRTAPVASPSSGDDAPSA